MISHTPGPWRRGWLHSYNAGTGEPEAFVYRLPPGDPQETAHNRICVRGSSDSRMDWDSDADLISLAPTAPHSCDIEGCPGAENKRRLDLFERYKQVSEAYQGRFEAMRNEEHLAREEMERRLEHYPALVEALRKAQGAMWEVHGGDSPMGCPGCQSLFPEGPDAGCKWMDEVDEALRKAEEQP